MLEELGDCAIMLVSALPPSYDFLTYPPRFYPSTIDNIVFMVADALNRGQRLGNNRIDLALHYIFHYSGFTLDVALRRVERILKKYTEGR